ncbi:MAG: universal stress protein, partial [Solirubrobacterales bacterium]|nr:universal stress protein [Solirubrobacterales bacterium]
MARPDPLGQDRAMDAGEPVVVRVSRDRCYAATPNAWRTMERRLRDLWDFDAEPVVMVGVRDSARTIMEVAGEHKAATIVVGSRGLRGLRARFEGSTSKGVVKHAPCPVVVHDPGS